MHLSHIFVSGTPVDFGKLASQFMAKPPANLSNDYEAAEIKELILCSYTRIVVEVRSTANILILLGHV